MNDPPVALTIDRLDETKEIVIAQSTSQCCRSFCCQPSINWVVSQQDNFEPGSNPYEIPTVGWIHEESSWCGRSHSWALPGCRAVKYVQHYGPAPEALVVKEMKPGCCTCQTNEIPHGITEEDRTNNILATHEKLYTCGYCMDMMYCKVPLWNCFPLPYLDTKDSSGKIIGKTLYVCDEFCFVPKYDVYMYPSGDKQYRIRPDTCCFGCCMKCRCSGEKGNCLRVPYVIRDPKTHEPLKPATNHESEVSSKRHAQIDVLWSGWKHQCFTQKNAYHILYPIGTTAQEKLLLTGSAILIDITMYEISD